MAKSETKPDAKPDNNDLLTDDDLAEVQSILDNALEEVTTASNETPSYRNNSGLMSDHLCQLRDQARRNIMALETNMENATRAYRLIMAHHKHQWSEQSRIARTCESALFSDKVEG